LLNEVGSLFWYFEVHVRDRRIGGWSACTKRSLQLKRLKRHNFGRQLGSSHFRS